MKFFLELTSPSPLPLGRASKLPLLPYFLGRVGFRLL
jgi:hypothetical protein